MDVHIRERKRICKLFVFIRYEKLKSWKGENVKNISMYIIISIATFVVLYMYNYDKLKRMFCER